MEKRKKKTKYNYSGMSLVEMMVVVMIFAVIIAASTALAGAYLRTRSALNKHQQQIEHMSVAINEMAKKIRMSNCHDNFIEECICTENGFYASLNGKYQFAYVFDTENDRLVDQWNSVILKDVRGKFECNNKDIKLVTITIYDISFANNDEEGEEIDLGSIKDVVKTSISQRSNYVQTE